MAQRACAPIRACDYSYRIAVDRVSFGEDCVSLGKHYPRDHCSNSAFARAQTSALRRFVEVSVGIIVALVAVALWPEHQPSAVKSAGE
jgi:hypothetical protein